GTGAEVSQRLVEAVPGVVECDRVSVWLWDEKTERLHFSAASGHVQEDLAALNATTISPAQASGLASQLTSPAPHFYYPDTEDEYMRELMQGTGIQALVVVPILSRESFLGLLSVSAVERPERLRPSDDLLERLTGVAALSATAMQAGRLIDELDHGASHD